MLRAADRDTIPVIDLFQSLGLEVGLLVPTDTGLSKSILDATEPFRAFLRETGLHDYALQPQGTDSKKIVEVAFVELGSVSSGQASLYRPETKDGDPRVWFYGLKSRVRSGNLLACFVLDSTIHVLNASDDALWRAAQNESSFVGQLLRSASQHAHPVELELVTKLRALAKKGWHKTVCHGATGVGMTLESLLGIKANSSKKPDYKGTELKSGRRKNGRRSSMQTLFSKTPDWNESPVDNAAELIERHGYIEDGRKQIYCTVNASGTSNGKGFFLQVDSSEELLVCYRNENGKNYKLLVWPLDELRSALAKKHKSTAWIGASHRGSGVDEEFLFETVEFTAGPPVSQLSEWIEQDVLTLDFTMHLKENGKVRDHGYLFRVHPRDFSRMFATPRKYSLL